MPIWPLIPEAPLIGELAAEVEEDDLDDVEEDDELPVEVVVSLLEELVPTVLLAA